MRRDIEIHINTGDVTLTSSQLPLKERPFRWVENAGGLQRYIYCEVDIPSYISDADIREKGWVCEIPYTARYKEFMIRVRKVNPDGSYRCLMNQVNGSDWFVVKSGLYGGEEKNTYASQLILVSKHCQYYMRINGESVSIYASGHEDFNIVDANTQNSNCLLACVPTNNYRYPLSGVGLIRWVNGNRLNEGKLADIIKREFSEDGVNVKSAYYDYDSNDMHLDLDAINVN